MAERVQVLELGAGAEFGRAFGTDGHVGVATEAAFLHVAVRDAEVDHDGVQGLEIGHRFLGTAHVGLAHDFDERHGGAVEVEIAVVAFVGCFCPRRFPCGCG